MSDQVEVIKLDIADRPVWSYQGDLLLTQPNLRIIEAHFDREVIDLGLIKLKPGDRMVEYFYSDRWYNVFEIFRGNGEFEGWYCNIARPAEFSLDSIRQVDLALDLIVNPKGKFEVIDREEFDQLGLPSQDRVQALRGLEQLKAMILGRKGPFERVQSQK